MLEDADSDRLILASLGTLEQVYQSAPVGLCVLDRQLRYVRINDFLARLNGRSPQEHIGRTVREMIPDAADEVEAIAARIFQRGTPEPVTESGGTGGARAGQEWTWRAAWHPIRNPEGRAIGISVVVEDITDRKRSEAALRASHEDFRTLAENSPAIVDRFDRQFRHLYVNARGLALHGRPAVEVIGKTIAETEVPEPFRSLWEQRIRQVFETGCPLDIDNSFPSPQGMRHFRSSCVPEGEAGAVRSVLVVSHDITARRRAEEELKHGLETLERRVAERTAELADSERKYRLLAENTRDIPFQIDRAGLLRYVGPQIAAYGLDPVRITGTHFLEYIHPDDRERAAARFHQSLLHDEDHLLEIRLETPAQGTRWFEERDLVQKDAEGRAIGITGILRDITESRRAARALEESEEKYRRLFEAETNSIILMDAATRQIVDVNEAALRTYGYTREEFLSLSVDQVSAESSDSAALIARATEDGHAEAPVRWHRRKDGSRFPIETRVTRYTWRGRDILCGISHEITAQLAKDQERQRALEALRESEEKYRKLFELETDGVIFIDMESRGVIDVNDAALNLYGYNRDEFMKVDVRSITAEPEATDELVARLMQQGTAAAPVRWHRRKGGTPVPVAVHAVLFTLRDRPVTFLVVRDISAQLDRDQEIQRAVEALRESEEKYRRLFETETDVIVLLDAETREILDANEAAVRSYGYTREEFLALRPGQYSEEPDTTQDFLSRVELFGAAQASVRWHRRKDGTRFPLQIHATRFTWRGREIICGVGRNISEQLASEGESRRQREALSRLAGEVTAAAERERRRIATDLHDNLVQLLVSCQVRVDQLLLESRPRNLKPTLQRVLEILDRAVKDTRDLTFHLAPPALEGVGLAAALDQLCREMTVQFGMPFAFRESGPPAALDMDRRQMLFRCVREIMINAGRHAKAKRVTVTLKQAAGIITLAVEDDGCGFDARQAGFDFSAEGGFGLFSARQQLLNVGASLMIQSTPGQGTRVVIESPLSQPGEPSHE